MKRSEINAILKKAKVFFDECRFHLPEWAYWTPDDWKLNAGACTEIADTMLGWDVTPFGSDDFYKRGLLLFTLRNGKPGAPGKQYAEKIMIVEEKQETPFHFHWQKREDIINRGGGNLVMEFYTSAEDERFADTPVTVRVDGIATTVLAGAGIVLRPGQSVCLEPGVYHRFYGEAESSRVLVGEVSSVNDDNSDNRFYESLGRFPGIEEDEEPIHLLATDYSRYL
jgi:D-lyxose ketol-isomerase